MSKIVKTVKSVGQALKGVKLEKDKPKDRKKKMNSESDCDSKPCNSKKGTTSSENDEELKSLGTTTTGMVKEHVAEDRGSAYVKDVVEESNGSDEDARDVKMTVEEIQDQIEANSSIYKDESIALQSADAKKFVASLELPFSRLTMASNPSDKSYSVISSGPGLVSIECEGEDEDESVDYSTDNEQSGGKLLEWLKSGGKEEETKKGKEEPRKVNEKNADNVKTTKISEEKRIGMSGSASKTVSKPIESQNIRKSSFGERNVERRMFPAKQVLRPRLTGTAPEWEPDSLNYYKDRPAPGFNAMLTEYQQRLAPLTCTLYFMEGTGTMHYYFEKPVDYLISWTDNCIATGFVKRMDDATDMVPLCIRFGGYWSNKAVRSMYVGCTVRVRGYLELKERFNEKETMAISPRGSSEKPDFLFAGAPRPSAYALEWAVVHKPKIIRSIGMLLEDQSYEKKGKRHLEGIVQDFEYNERLVACHEKWPVPEMKALPIAPCPLIINWIEVWLNMINETVIIHRSQQRHIVLPDYIHYYLRTNQPVDKTYVFGWVDLAMKESRVFD
ncbi:unnamed protein product [Bursaphelenchus okinawaensis]|uniref:Uncharacterized protein n=1 Tax=Bursaphelenchus okinawaensis TaxID=465554 RepID=A0A811LMQ9_9BILA|nr:unnamed protein product [Bursaphelenchus okinawaensis]CAG9127234.1 unnamed protein product [Bursaphelenchus okinawaensis]